MSLLNFIQPIHSTRPTNTSTHIPYRLTPCAKTLGALLFILSSTAAWASVDVAGNQLTQAEKMAQRTQALELKLAELKLADPIHTMLARVRELTQLELVMAHKEQSQARVESAEALEQQLAEAETQLLQDPKLAPTLALVLAELEQTPALAQAQKMTPYQSPRLTRMLVELAKAREKLAQANTEVLRAKAQGHVEQVLNKIEAELAKEQQKQNPPKAAPIPAPKPVPAIKDNPQIGSYIANQINAQKMFITDDLQHRQRETHYIDPITGEKKSTHMWLNTYNAKNRYNSGDKQLHTKSSRYAIQLGGPISKWSSGGNDQGLLGITAGFGRATSDSHAIESNRYARGTVEGYNLGLYHLWHANNDTQLGLYIDLLAQYSFFKNQARTQGLGAFTNYKSYLFTTALETGYKAQLFEKKQARLFVQPNAKVSWQRASGLQHYKATDAQVTIEESDSVATKLGIRTALEFDVDTLSAKALQVSPSFEANWMHDNGNKGAWLSHTYVAPQGNRSIAELKLGIEGKINSNLQLWTHVGQQFGHEKYSETQITLGGNYHF
ncbi:autotransporter family protein [Yersinia mollaretii]|uniref:autotransporter family protein n=1 Tax=Yersinia mollaretii TaxID=33060 RepID=UPI00119D1E25|nr:autotransporter outer membrane beta-barrel domain-containing protein [Yersinia mollaretii]